VGMPMLSMHSIREQCGTSDLTFASRVFDAFFSAKWREVDRDLSVDVDDPSSQK